LPERVRARLGGRALEALCLDLDDTILDSEWCVRAGWERVADLVGVRRPELERSALLAAIERTAGWFWADEERHRRGRLDLEAARFEVIAQALGELAAPDPGLAREAAELYTAFRQRELRLFAGALEVLGRLRASVPRLALVTNGASLPQREKIERFDLTRFFDHVQVEGEFGAGKPDPVVYAHVLDRLGAPAGTTLMVGDNYACDVLGALAAGMHAAWIDPTGRGQTPSPPPRAHLVLRGLAELPGRLGI
jgi:putative hydrolase of the HAD superfamily